MIFYLPYLLYPAWQVTTLQRPLICVLGTAFLCLRITCLLECCEIHSDLWIENVLACKVLNRNTVFISILLRFAFVSLRFYRTFTTMLRIHLFFLVWQQKHCCSLKSHSLSLDFHNYKHVGKKNLLVCFFPREDKPWETSMMYSEIYTCMWCHTRMKGTGAFKETGGRWGKTEERSEHNGNLKIYRNKWFCKVLFYDTKSS